MSRPPKLDEDLIRKFGAAVSIGARPDQVARALGVGKSTFYSWIARGKAPGPGDHVYVEFVETISKARGSAYVTLIADLRNIAKRDPRAAIRLLETIDREWETAAEGGASSQTGASTIEVIVSRKEPTRASAEGEPEPDNGYPAAPAATARTRVIIDVGPHEPEGAPSDPGGDAQSRPAGEDPQSSSTPYPRVVIDVNAKRSSRADEPEAVAP